MNLRRNLLNIDPVVAKEVTECFIDRLPLDFADSGIDCLKSYDGLLAIVDGIADGIESAPGFNETTRAVFEAGALAGFAALANLVEVEEMPPN